MDDRNQATAATVPAPLRVDALDHLVLTVADIAVTVSFYGRVLGMTPVTFGEGRTALSFGDQKINLHQAGREFEPKARTPLPGSADLCFRSNTAMTDILAHLKAVGVEVEDGPVTRTGARSALLSVYIRDPDGNLIEISNEVGPL